ncbi:MAG: DNA-binding domain-containing protein [Pseudomonadota bacterium]
MNEFERLQDEFQRSIMSGDNSVLADILDSPKEKRDILFGVYRYAYVSRLVEALRNDHAHLHGYLGDEMFDEMGAAYVAASPSQHPNMRWFSQGLPEFLRTTEPYCDHPVIADLAAFEKALNDGFDAADGPVTGIEDVAAFPPEVWNDLKFQPHPTSCRLDLVTNAIEIWKALKDEQAPPDAVMLDEPNRALIWRQDVTPMFRELPAEEAMMWDEASGGIPFGVLCSMLATYDDPDSAAARGAGYLHGWVTSGLLSSVTLANVSKG